MRPPGSRDRRDRQPTLTSPVGRERIRAYLPLVPQDACGLGALCRRELPGCRLRLPLLAPAAPLSVVGALPPHPRSRGGLRPPAEGHPPESRAKASSPPLGRMTQCHPWLMPPGNGIAVNSVPTATRRPRPSAGQCARFQLDHTERLDGRFGGLCTPQGDHTIRTYALSGRTRQPHASRCLTAVWPPLISSRSCFGLTPAAF